MIKQEQMKDFVDSNGYYGLEEMVELLTDIANGVYEYETFVSDVKDYVEYAE